MIRELYLKKKNKAVVKILFQDNVPVEYLEIYGGIKNTRDFSHERFKKIWSIKIKISIIILE